MDDPKERLLDAALPHVPFDGWSEATLKRAAEDADMTLAEARAHVPRGAVGLALAFHRRGDRIMAERYAAAELGDMRYRDRVAYAVRLRIEAIEDKEAARRAATLFALPMHSGAGARAIWDSADAIWRALGDSSTDGNWYTKRATLSGVYSSTFIYWLGDESAEYRDTWEFLDRRIDDVMQIERMRGRAKENPVTRAMVAGPEWLLSRMRAPSSRKDYPGRWNS